MRRHRTRTSEPLLTLPDGRSCSASANGERLSLGYGAKKSAETCGGVRATSTTAGEARRNGRTAVAAPTECWRFSIKKRHYIPTQAPATGTIRICLKSATEA